MIILVGGEKGGSGKSCLAQNLAVYLQQKKETYYF
jgi:chromosome partitioning protein